VRKSRFNEEQIIAILRESEGGADPGRAVSPALHHARKPVPLEGKVRRDAGRRRGSGCIFAIPEAVART